MVSDSGIGWTGITFFFVEIELFKEMYKDFRISISYGDERSIKSIAGLYERCFSCSRRRTIRDAQIDIDVRKYPDMIFS